MQDSELKTAFEIDLLGEGGDIEEALGMALELIKDGSNDEDIYFIAAKLAFQLGDFIKSEQLLSKLLTLDPDHIKAWVLMSEINKAQLDMIRYKNSLKMAEELFPTLAEFDLLKSGITMKSSAGTGGQSKSADSDDSAFTTMTFAEICINQGYFNKAMKILTDLLAADPDNPELKQRIAELEKKINRKTGN